MSDVWDAAAPAQEAPENPTAGQTLALYVSAFFDELRRAGVRDVVVCPGSRSTPLSIVAYESPMNVFVDVDERGAAFFALGIAKSVGRPVAVVCTSGTAVGNFLPAVMEAECSRVPLIILSGDRPAHLQGLGAPQTCDQVKIFGDYVRMFRQMPAPSADAKTIAYVRQMAIEATSAAAGAHDASFGANGGSLVDAGPVHLNFPFSKPLNPDLDTPGLFKIGARANTDKDLPSRIGAWSALGPNRANDILRYLEGKRAIAICGERTVAGGGQAKEFLAWAEALNIPLFADPLSRLRCFDRPLVIDNYDSFVHHDDMPEVDVVIRFGRWPISQRLTSWMEEKKPIQIVVDPRETRDFTCSTDIFVRTTPMGFADALAKAHANRAQHADTNAAQQHLASEMWMVNEAARKRIEQVTELDEGFEGVFMDELLDVIPEGSLLFSGNSMAIRTLDTVLCKSEKMVHVLCNRGLNGIDGTLSTAFGAAQHFDQSVAVLGDLSFLHDINALALQGEMLIREGEGYKRPNIVVVVLNNNGGAIFDMLPQKTDKPYYGRLFYTPQLLDVEAAAKTFGVGYRSAANRAEFAEAFDELVGVPGISILEVKLPLQGVKERFQPYWG